MAQQEKAKKEKIVEKCFFKALHNLGFSDWDAFYRSIPQKIAKSLALYGAKVKCQRFHAGKANEIDDKKRTEDYMELMKAWKNGDFGLKASPVDKEKIKREAINELLASLPEDLQKIIKEKAGI